jgi:hypothetical protein
MKDPTNAATPPYRSELTRRGLFATIAAAFSWRLAPKAKPATLKGWPCAEADRLNAANYQATYDEALRRAREVPPPPLGYARVVERTDFGGAYGWRKVA